MTTTGWMRMLALGALVTGLGGTAGAAPPTFRIAQVFTSMDGSYQVVELVEWAGLDDQHRLAGLTLTMSHAGRVRTITFDDDLPSTRTAHVSLLLLTTFYVDPLDGPYPPIYGEPGLTTYGVMPPRFLDTQGGTLDFAGVDSVTLPPLPTDGLRAWYRDGTLAAATRPLACESAPCGRTTFERSRIPVTEFYNAEHFAFLPTTDAIEIEALDDGRVAGWRRSTDGFMVGTTPLGAFTTPVCRFYAPSSTGGGHVLSALAAECAALAQPGSGFVLESAAAFYVALPDPATGACAAGTPVHRYWNTANGADHRYTMFKKVFVPSVGPLGAYVAEGYGPDGVAFCAPSFGGEE